MVAPLPVRAIRIDDATWANCGERAALEGLSGSGELVRKAIEAYLLTPIVKAPPQADPKA